MNHFLWLRKTLKIQFEQWETFLFGGCQWFRYKHLLFIRLIKWNCLRLTCRSRSWDEITIMCSLFLSRMSNVYDANSYLIITEWVKLNQSIPGIFWKVVQFDWRTETIAYQVHIKRLSILIKKKSLPKFVIVSYRISLPLLSPV